MKSFFLVVFSISALSTSAQVNAEPIHTNTERNLIPEGITMNPADGMIYISSIAQKKIVAIDSNGKHTDFITGNETGYLEGLGMKIDAEKQWLWGVSNEKQGEWNVSRIHAFDLKAKEVKRRYEIKDTARHLLNDLIFHPNGKVYITDTYAASIYEADPAKQELTVFIRDSLIAYPNGIAYNKTGNIYIATYSHGLMQLDVVSKKLSPLSGYTDSVKAFSLDGLVYWDNTIIGVYNGAENNKDNAIVQYFLNDEGDKIVRERVIDKGNEFFHEPTTNAVAGNNLYVLANSYLAVYNANNESVEGIDEKLGPVTILVYRLQ